MLTLIGVLVGLVTGGTGVAVLLRYASGSRLATARREAETIRRIVNENTTWVDIAKHHRDFAQHDQVRTCRNGAVVSAHSDSWKSHTKLVKESIAHHGNEFAQKIAAVVNQRNQVG